MNFQDAIDTIVQELQSMIQRMLSRADYDRTYTGVVVSVSYKDSVNSYTVRINGVEYIIDSKLNYDVGNYVYVLVMRNNWNNLRLLPIEYECNN